MCVATEQQLNDNANMKRKTPTMAKGLKVKEKRRSRLLLKLYEARSLSLLIIALSEIAYACLGPIRGAFNTIDR